MCHIQLIHYLRAQAEVLLEYCLLSPICLESAFLHKLKVKWPLSLFLSLSGKPTLK